MLRLHPIKATSVYILFLIFFYLAFPSLIKVPQTLLSCLALLLLLVALYSVVGLAHIAF